MWIYSGLMQKTEEIIIISLIIICLGEREERTLKLAVMKDISL